ncbi:MAG: carboxypeptidase regulatory-like domain-containing protein [Planctomycetes bacterium]|nr:carboxypeptidase regulatory-like domain-containing protein [Planctomycetota bacterium]
MKKYLFVGIAVLIIAAIFILQSQGIRHQTNNPPDNNNTNPDAAATSSNLTKTKENQEAPAEQISKQAVTKTETAQKHEEIERVVKIHGTVKDHIGKSVRGAFVAVDIVPDNTGEKYIQDSDNHHQNFIAYKGYTSGVYTNKKGKFSIEIKYKTKQHDILYIGVVPDFSSKQLALLENISNVPKNKRYSKNEPTELCYSAPQKFILANEQEIIESEIIFNCAETATITLDGINKDTFPEILMKFSDANWAIDVQLSPNLLTQKWVLDVPSNTSFDLLISLEGYLDTRHSFNQLKPGENIVLELNFEKGTEELTGVCLDENGVNVMPGVYVSAIQDGLSAGVSTVTDQSGRFTLKGLLKKKIRRLIFNDQRHGYRIIELKDIDIHSPIEIKLPKMTESERNKFNSKGEGKKRGSE